MAVDRKARKLVESIEAAEMAKAGNGAHRSKQAASTTGATRRKGRA